MSSGPRQLKKLSSTESGTDKTFGYVGGAGGSPKLAFGLLKKASLG